MQEALQLRPGLAWQPEEAGQESAQQADNTSDQTNAPEPGIW